MKSVALSSTNDKKVNTPVINLGNIICWYDESNEEPEMAFSFQNQSGTNIIWKLLKEINAIQNLNLKILEDNEQVENYSSNKTNIFEENDDQLSNPEESMIVVPTKSNLD